MDIQYNIIENIMYMSIATLHALLITHYIELV